MGKTALIIQREYLSRVKKKSFIVMTILGPILMAGFVGLAVYLSVGLQEEQHVLVVDDTTLFNDLPSGEDVNFSYTDKSMEEVKAEFDSSAYNAILWIPRNFFDQSVYAEASFKLLYKSQPGYSQLDYIRKVMEERTEHHRMLANNIKPEVFKKLVAKVELDLIAFDEGAEKTDLKERAGIGMFFAVMIYFFIFMYGVQVMKGVIEEKTSRIVEVIISSVKPFQLMMGKIIGVALVGLTQFLLWVLLTGGLLFVVTGFLVRDQYDPQVLVEEMQMSSELMKQSQAEAESVNSDNMLDMLSRINFVYFLSMFLFYFLGGYLLYSAMFAAIGAAVDNETETQQFMLPVTLPLIFGFIVAQLSMQNPDGPAAVWFSIIPFTAPVVMMVRIAVVPIGELYWQLILSMTLLVATFFAATWLAAKIYRTGILMYGKKVNYREVWKWIFFKG